MILESHQRLASPFDTFLYRGFSQQASVQALEADRHAEEYQQQVL
jgi:hypothetical protein